MKTLWAPWRIKYIKEKTSGCFLCRANEENHDAENLVIYRGRDCFCMLNKYPYNSGHVMVVTKKHKGDISELTSHEMLEMMMLVKEVREVLIKKMHPDGFNIGLNLGKEAGAGVTDHIHIHVVPRWMGDTNFMPVFTDTKVIPQSLEELYHELKDCFTKS
ncbi:MAG TPA: HIT family protein [Candidatus Brocadiia bacterium]|nr:HIT domain-containing protein [Planctomycetota bacterium]MBI4007198.1 HIT domain-containing protein [Planctomycetota bacterium]MDO8092358.1 HIT domain-containing protein [Candidatus Brocadiales bacterium]